jgi:hypothetical protein
MVIAASPIVVTPIVKPARLNRAQRRAIARAAINHRRQYCQCRCDVCNDYIPRHYCNRIKNPRLKADQKRHRARRKAGQPTTEPLKIITECFDCYTVRREASRAEYQRWCSTHRLHALDRMLRLMAWCGIRVDAALAWRRFTVLDKPAQIEAIKEIEECTAGMIDDYREIAEPHPFAVAMDEMEELQARLPEFESDDNATTETVEMAIEVHRMMGEADIALSDSDWRRLHQAVLYYLNAYRIITPESN